MTLSSRWLVPALMTFCVGALLCSRPAVAGGPVTAAQPAALSIVESTDRLIVRLREPDTGVVAASPTVRLEQIGGRIGARLQRLRGMSGYAHVVQLSRLHSRAEAAALSRQLARDPDVLYAEPDLRMVPMRAPNDPSYAQQWQYFEAIGGINLPAAWDRTIGSASITVAVLDTGLTAHPELDGRRVAGYDFIVDTTTSQDGDGRDPDPADPGDHSCNGNNSSWHGTHVAGTIGAASDNGSGVTGVNWTSKIQPVRVLGRCGGYSSDIADGMRWAAGIAVAGVPVNATPARVLNLSLGGTGSCGTTFQNAINDVVSRGTVVVVAAGNDNVDAANATPANCTNVITVAASTRGGARASYSNFGSKVALTAPGSSILSTLNTGTTTPGAPGYALYSGTSMATPHVAGVVSLMLSLDPSMTPAQVLTALRSSARAFPTGTGADCTVALCGAGIVDAAAALSVAVPPNPPVSGRVNLALPSNGTVMTASSTYGAGYAPVGANNGDRKGSAWGAGGGWNDATPNVWGDWLQADFGTAKSVAEINIFTVQDAYTNPAEPAEAMTFTQYGITDFEVQYWTGTTWEAVPGGSVTGNNRVWRRFAFAPVVTSKIRVLVLRSPDIWSRITELEAYAETTVVVPPNPPVSGRVNLVLPSSGAVMSASSTHSAGYAPVGANNGDRKGSAWGAGGGWNDATPNAWGDWLQADFGTAKSVAEINVFTVQDNYTNPAEPTEAMTFTQYGITDFEVQYWTGTAWQAVPGGSVTGNNRVWRRFAFAPVVTSKIRVLVLRAPDIWSRVTELEAYAEAGAITTVNHASAANGGVALASSVYSAGYAAAAVTDGERRGVNWGSGGGWNDATINAWPDSVQVNFSGSKTISEIDVYTVQDDYTNPQVPTEAMTFGLYGITDFDVQAWNGAAWVTVPGGSVTGNDRVWRKFTFAPLTTSGIRVVVNRALGGYTRITEIEAFGLP